MKNISPKIKVGGAGFALGYDNFHYGQLLGNWKKRNIQPDFISVYAYSYLLQQQNGVYFGRRSIDNSFIKNQLELFKKELEKLDFQFRNLLSANGILPFPIVTVSMTVVVWQHIL